MNINLANGFSFLLTTVYCSSAFQPGACACEESLEHVGDAPLQLGADAAFSGQTSQHVQLARVLPAQLDVLHDANQSLRAALLKSGGVAQVVLLFRGGWRPLDTPPLISSLLDGENH